MYVCFAAVAVLILYYLQFYIYKKKWNSNLKIEIFFKNSDAYEGEEAELTQIVENAKWLPLPMVKTKLQLSRDLIFKERDNTVVSDYFNRTDVFTIGSFQKITRSMKFLCSKRGFYRIKSADVLSTDVFFTRDFVDSITSDSFMYVFPKPYDPKKMEPLYNEINGPILTKNNLVEDPFELKGIREYQTYDSFKNINWKASAKTDDLMVNVRDYTSKRTIDVYLNLESNTALKYDELSELCISMAIAAITYYCKMSIPVSVHANTKDILNDSPIWLDYGSSDTFIKSANCAFARIDLAKDCYKFADLFLKKREKESDTDSFMIFFSPNMQDDFQSLLLELKKNEKDFLWVCPSYKEIKLEVNETLKKNTVEIDAKEALYEISLY